MSVVVLHVAGACARSLMVDFPNVEGAAPEAVRRKILVIDDQPTLAKAIRRMLGDHDVTVVAGGREALDKIEAGERYDVILSDVMMPEISGMDLHATSDGVHDGRRLYEASARVLRSSRESDDRKAV
jgi:PleD family two-component response regulator